MPQNNRGKKKNKKPKQKKISVDAALEQAERFNEGPPHARGQDDSDAAPVVLQNTDLSETTRVSAGVFRVKLKTGPSDTGHAGVRRFCLKRLSIDLLECRNDPLPMIAAEPLEDNMLEWHANVVGPPDSPYEDCCFHMTIQVPDNYPATAPKVKLQTYLDHPNVFRKWICLDMLEGQWVPDNRLTQKKDDVGYGWTPAYSIQTILVQLQAFLFDLADTSWWAKYKERRGFNSTTRRARIDAKTFICTKCQHRGYRPYPEPLIWKERLKYMVPPAELNDAIKVRGELFQFLHQVNAAVVKNQWPRLRPLKNGTFFSWMLLPRWEYSFYDYDATERKDEEEAKKEGLGFIKMKKNHIKVIRGLMNTTREFLTTKPRPNPMKGLFLERMYRIESALELAVDTSYNKISADRERGFWEWKMTRDLSCSVEELSEATAVQAEGDGKAAEMVEDTKESATEDANDMDAWEPLPPRISNELEALFLRRLADQKRPNELVRYRSKKKMKLGVICRVPWWRRHERPNEQGKVLVMPIDPARTTNNTIWWFWNGPLMDIGRRHYGRYTKTRYDGRKDEHYYKNSIIIDRYWNKTSKLWSIVIHPLPGRNDKSVAGWFDPADLELVAEGKKYKSYVRGDDGLHYVLDTVEETCRCIEKSAMTEIRRMTRNMSAPELWKHICSLVQADNNPWKEPLKKPIEPFELIDFNKYFGRCAWVDWTPRKPDADPNEEMDVEAMMEAQMESKQHEMDDDDDEEEMKEREAAFPQELRSRRKRMFLDYDETICVSDHECELTERGPPVLDERVHGIIVRIESDGVWVDVGCGENLLMELDQCRMSISARKKRIRSTRQQVDNVLRSVGEKKDLLKYHRKLKRKKKPSSQQRPQSTPGQPGASPKKKRNRRRRRGGGGGGGGSSATNGSAVVNGRGGNAVEQVEETKEEPRRKKKNKRGGGNNQQSSTQPQQQQTPKKKGKKKKQKQGNTTPVVVEPPPPPLPPPIEEDDEPPFNFRALEAEIDKELRSLSRISARKTINRTQECALRVGDHVDVWVYDDDVDETSEIQLTQYRPIQTLRPGDVFDGYVRGVTPYAVFVDFGCQEDGFLHKTLLEAGLSNRLVFDCHTEVKVGDFLRVRVTFVDIQRSRVEIGIDVGERPPDRLLMPDDVNETSAVFGTIFGLMPDDVTELSFQYLDRGDLHRTRDVCKLFQRIIDDKTGLRWEVEELKCFHTKQTFRDEVLGMGVNLTRFPKSDMLQDIEPRLSFVSARSFNDYGNRISAWKETFTNWLPVYINKEHGSRSLAWAKQQMAKMISREPRDWNPHYALEIIPTLMNTMVVRVMKGELHESIVALEGYTMFYHLLLAFVTEYPSLQAKIDRNIALFLDNENNRNKKKVPSLGKWIALLAVSDRFTWRDVATTYLRENFDRNVKWILTQFFSLNEMETPRAKRLRQSFLATQVSVKLCMFHVCFLRLLRYSPRSGLLQNVRDTKEKLDALYGRPTHNMRESLQRNVKRIKKTRTWKEFFRGVGIAPPSDVDLEAWLIEALINSERRGYHKLKYLRPKDKKSSNVDQGDKYDQIADAYEGGPLTIQAKKKQSVGDQMIAAF